MTVSKRRNCLAVCYCLLLLSVAARVRKSRDEKPIKRKRLWVKSWLQQKDRFSHMQLIKHLKDNNPEDFRNYLRMNDAAFDALLDVVEAYIRKHDTHMRTCIPAKDRLAATLRFLATGRSLRDLSYSTAISYQALSRIIPDTCQVIVSGLRETYMKVRETNHLII